MCCCHCDLQYWTNRTLLLKPEVPLYSTCISANHSAVSSISRSNHLTVHYLDFWFLMPLTFTSIMILKTLQLCPIDLVCTCIGFDQNCHFIYVVRVLDLCGATIINSIIYTFNQSVFMKYFEGGSFQRASLSINSTCGLQGLSHSATIMTFSCLF